MENVLYVVYGEVKQNPQSQLSKTHNHIKLSKPTITVNPTITSQIYYYIEAMRNCLNVVLDDAFSSEKMHTFLIPNILHCIYVYMPLLSGSSKVPLGVYYA